MDESAGKNSDQDRPWFQKWFGKDYLLVYPARNDAEALAHIPFLEKVLGLKKGEWLLDLCCGNGRYSIPLARRGYRVTGQDLSFALLTHARKRAKDAGCDISFFQADMRTTLFPGAFDFLIQMFTSFGYFATDRGNLETLQNIRSSLRPGGRYLIDYLNPEFVLKNLIPESSEKRENHLIRQLRRFEPSGKRLEKMIIIEEGTSRRVYSESVRLYSTEEIASMLKQAGLELTHIYGSFAGTSFCPESPRMILTGEKS